jgi:hypothetical protein
VSVVITAPSWLDEKAVPEEIKRRLHLYVRNFCGRTINVARFVQIPDQKIILLQRFASDPGIVFSSSIIVRTGPVSS